MNPRSKRLAMGCGGGCLLVTLLGVAGCVAFTSWLRAPGELLEAQALLDPQAVGYVEGTLELDNPGTRALFEAATTLMREREPPIDAPFVRVLFAWNRQRQIRDLERIFPARFSWTLYPAEADGRLPGIVSVSVEHASHQIMLFDWVLGLIARRSRQMPTFEHHGERVMVLRDERHEPLSAEEGPATADEPIGRRGPAYLFMREEGVFFATAEGPVRRAIERLEGVATNEPAPGPGRVEEELASVSTRLQFRGAFLNPHGELVTLLEDPLDDMADATRRERLRAMLGDVTTVTIGGGFEPAGNLVLELVLFAEPPPPELAALIDELLAEAQEDVPIEWSVESRPDRLQVSIRLEEVERLVREHLDSLLEDRIENLPREEPPRADDAR